MIRAGLLILTALALAGCQSTQQKSARLEKRARHFTLRSRGLTVTKPGVNVKVLSSQVLRGTGSDAVIVTLRSSSPRPLRDIPIAITLRSANGRVLFRNDTPGIEAALTSLALLEPGQRAVWIDDQARTNEPPTSVNAIAGEGQPASGPLPRLRISAAHAQRAPGSAGAETGIVTNDSASVQQNLVVYGIALRGDEIVGAGRAIVAEVPAHGSSHFEMFFVGSTAGARLSFSSAPSPAG